jgi:hypothetical protein
MSVAELRQPRLLSQLLLREDIEPMTDLNRGIMKFSGADSLPIVALSGLLILGAIAGLILWALQSAYAIA